MSVLGEYSNELMCVHAQNGYAEMNVMEMNDEHRHFTRFKFHFLADVRGFAPWQAAQGHLIFEYKDFSFLWWSLTTSLQ